MRKITALLSESFRFAWMALVSNKLRTFLSLLGITIGIFAIIAVYAIVDSLERNIRQSVESLGSDVVYVQKWPWGGDGGEYAWWKYFQRPEVGITDFKRLMAKNLRTAESLTYIVGSSETLKMGNSSVERVEINGVTFNYGALNSLDIAEGRYFTESEMNSARNVIILGADVADGLFPSGKALGESVQTFGRRFTVIGILPKEGANIIGQSHDSKAMIPATLFTFLKGDEFGGSAIQAKVKQGFSTLELKEELRMHMRAIRRLKPISDDDFTLNESSVFSQGLDTMFGAIGIAGTVIGGFSILVGGFGIANIMFVSVRERTGQIGIQKALGATRSFILTQFLVESTLLSLAGGLAGLILVAGLMMIGSAISGFELAMSSNNVLTGILLSAGIGLLSGLAPASMAARLDPVEAIRFNQ
ncbi:MAG: ABC transporter permease [Schleiferiaceae bacterium]|nr:ABC transporter permease [Schleiferiaceae bacterium]